ncbi:hypothetical protein SLA2020_046760 [Shorea laevis]
MQVLCDVDCGKEFILCEYNRDSDSYRSPWSNKYHPPLEDGPYPSAKLRKLEIEAKDIFGIYLDQYYEAGFSSVYMWEDESEGFVACFLIKKDRSKTAHGRRGYLEEGAWDAIHVVEMNLNLPAADGHLCNMGKMIEEMESKPRYSLDQVYFGKTK